MTIFDYKLNTDINKAYYHNYICTKLQINITDVKMVLFLTHKKEQPYSYCSNFYYGTPYHIGMLEFLHRQDVDTTIANKISLHLVTCTEQAIMIIKAAIMKDYDMVNILLGIENLPSNTSDDDIKDFCKKIKGLGRNIKHFKQDVWNIYLPEIVVRVLLEKFRVNTIKNMLIDNGPCIYAEAASYDSIWGIGMDAQNIVSQDITSWCGYNMLGYGITAVSNYYSQELQSTEDEEKFIASYCNIFTDFLS